MKQLRVAILDDQALSRNGLRVLVEQAGIPAGQVDGFAGIEALMTHLARVAVRVLLLSDQLPGGQDVVELVAALHQRYPGLAQVVVSSRLNTAYIGALFAGGARGFVYHKSRLEQTIPAALKSMTQGETYLSPEAAALPYHQRAVGQLSERDLEVLALLAAGRSVPEIAQTLGSTRRVVYNIRTRLKQYLNVTNNEQIIAAAYERGLLTS